ncbi:MAG: phosphoribosylaminoimidazolesuccinocarboxamide synthase [Planctomycetaceae bacterium]|jgi:phosphoribosylaminoimidazole-succinocarboxamide synthase|nr:phosphoribosylaminoimidazolesuccinocarboxamide synthase [Planctomycetaceae bacterium]MDG2388669.1 phosphoribosylaminoimidazolesuccinocarboxamide synthase [Planctomycetaceae bacterium]
MSSTAYLNSELPGLPKKQGKVRDLYDFGDRLLMVASDRISAFDWVLPNGIPDKGRVLTGVSLMWFDELSVKNHLISTDPSILELPDGTDLDNLQGRSMVVRKTEVVPIECVVRGFLAGSGWKEYQQTETVCGINLPSGLQQSSQLPEPIFTPATKAEEGHDENISFDRMVKEVGAKTAEQLREMSLGIYTRASEYAAERGVILADTKFEFGRLDGELILIDEVLTPDSSRYWPADQYQPGGSQPSFDKQFVRDWLETTDWDKNSPPPTLPAEIVTKTRDKYIEAYRLLVGDEFPWV